MLKLKEGQYCGMSRSKQWRRWLLEYAKDLGMELEATIKSGRGCKSNRLKMLDIKKKIYERDLGPQFEEFIQKTFPFLIIRDEPDIPEHRIARNVTVSTALSIPVASKNVKLNKHKVFRFYRPDMLKFPHHVIIQDSDSKKLAGKMKEFISDKIGVETLIIEDTAYIEYFMPKFSSVMHKTSPRLYEIKKYKKAHGIKV